MELKTIDQIEALFVSEIERVLGENRKIELAWGDGTEWDVSTNIAMKYRESVETAERVAAGISKQLLMLESVEISENNHLNMMLGPEWHEILLKLYIGRGLDICDKSQSEETLLLDPVSKSEVRVKSYKKAMEKICALIGVTVEFGPTGETVLLGDMEIIDEMPEEIADIVGISRGNKTDIAVVKYSRANDMKNPHFKWNYINYRLSNIAKLLENHSAREYNGLERENLRLQRPEIWRLMLLKLKLKKALDEAIRFRDPFKYYAWMEEYLDSFYSLGITRDTFTPEIARALKIF